MKKLFIVTLAAIEQVHVASQESVSVTDGGKAMSKYCAATILLAWMLWEYTAAFPHGTKSETWHHMDAHYFEWTCKLESYWEAWSLANNNLRSTYMGWNSAQIDRPNEPSELDEFICFPEDVDPLKLRLWR